MSIADDVLEALAPLVEAGNGHAARIRTRIFTADNRDAETHRQLTDLAGTWQVLVNAMSTLTEACTGRPDPEGDPL